MKKKNVLLLVIDSMTANDLYNPKYLGTVTPFLSKLMNKSVVVDNFYSEGPHTGAGLQGLLCGTNTLDDNAFLRSYSDKKWTIFDCFLENGYDLLDVSWADNFLPSRFEGKVQWLYTDGSEFSRIVYWAFLYYKELYDKGEMNEVDVHNLIKCYEDAFTVSLDFLDVNMHNEQSYNMVRQKIKHINFIKRAEEIRKEYNQFLEDKKEYIMENLRIGNVSDIFKEEIIDNNGGVDREKLKRLYNHNKTFFKKLKYKQVINNLFDSKLDYARLIKELPPFIIGNRKTYILNEVIRLLRYKEFDIQKMERRCLDGMSMKKTLDYMVEVLANRPNNSKPFFCYSHLLSQHAPTEWFSYDAEEEEIQKEIDSAKRVIKENGSHRGSFTYLMGMRYVDECVERLFKELKNFGVLKDTMIIITADHGSSNCFAPVRDKGDHNNCHSELYHIPLIIYNSGETPRHIDGLWQNKDLLPSIMEIMGITTDKNLSGHSIFDDSFRRKNVHSERTDMGAPVLEHRNVIYTVWNDRFKIEYECSVFDNIEKGKMNEVYNLKKDPYELKNIIKTYCREEIADLMLYLKNRHNELSANYRAFREELLSE